MWWLQTGIDDGLYTTIKTLTDYIMPHIISYTEEIEEHG